MRRRYVPLRLRCEAILMFVFSDLRAMAGIGVAFLFVPLFYYLGVPLAEATPSALLLNVVMCPGYGE